MNPGLCTRLLELYTRAESALVGDDIEAASALIAEAGSAIAAAPAEGPIGDPRERATRASLLQACESARAATEAALFAARARALTAAAKELRGGGTTAAYAPTGHSDARFIDRTS